MGSSLLILAAYAAVACGGSEKEPNTASDAENAESAEVAATDDSALSDDATSDSASTDESDSNAGSDPAGAGGSEDPQDTRTTEVMAQVVKDNRHLFRLCYEKVQKKTPDIKGDLVVSFTVSPQGKVTKAEVDGNASTLKNAEVGACAVEEMKKLTFPESSRGMESTMNYPFNFNPR
jgi:TonB family protein